MIILIVVITIILYILLFAFSINNLGPTIDNKVKLIYTIIGLIIMTIITLIVFYISTNGVEYENQNMIKDVRNIILAVFIPINGIITLPYIANLLSKISSNEITQEQLKKKVIILSILFIFILIFECSYLKSTQLGILNLLKKAEI